MKPDVKKLVQQIQLFNPFGRTCEELFFISTDDVASNEIRNDILSVTMRGSQHLTNLLKNDCYLSRLVIFTMLSPKTNPKHLRNLKNVHVATPSGKDKIIKADRNLFRI